jgi:hypothetical protein
MRNVVVAAACSKAGKTLFSSALVGELVRLGFRVSAFKLAHKPGEPPWTEHGPGRGNSDTARLIAAGALRTALVRSPDVRGLDRAIEELPGDEDFCVWESNAAATLTNPHYLVYIAVRLCPDPKDAELEERADQVLTGPLSECTAALAAKEAAAARASRTRVRRPSQ